MALRCEIVVLDHQGINDWQSHMTTPPSSLLLPNTIFGVSPRHLLLLSSFKVRAFLPTGRYHLSLERYEFAKGKADPAL
jgi:hypothetical protein